MRCISELLAAQHAQIEDLFELVTTLRDPDALDELADTVAYHLSVETELLYPSLSPPLPLEILDEIAAEHREIRRVLTDLLWFGEADEEFDRRLETLGALLDGHIGYQEDEVFGRAARVPFMYERAAAHASSAA